MPDKKRFYDDPGLLRLETTIIATGALEGRPWVRLDETVFYPEGGGQPSDRGRIGGAEVVEVLTRGEEVLHVVDRPLAPGPVALELDWARRFDHCQQHTAQHLLTAVLVDRHDLPTTSFHLGADYTSIEVRGAVPSREALRRYEAEVNAHLREDRGVTSRWVAPEDLPALNVRSRGLPEGHDGPVRLVEIEGLDLNTCGGTHVRRLAEIQAIEIVNAEPARGGTRIRFLAGGRVLADLERRRGIEDALKARIGTAPDEFATVIDGWGAERKRLERRVGSLEGELAEALASTLSSAPGPVLCAVRPDAGPDALRALAAAVLRRRPEAVVALAGSGLDAGEGCFLVQSGSSGPPDVAGIGGRVRDLMGAKGGGKGRSFQGKGGVVPDLDALRRAAGIES
jgi:Ser-tRNA(Ala) deacylase AlaX